MFWFRVFNMHFPFFTFCLVLNPQYSFDDPLHGCHNDVQNVSPVAACGPCRRRSSTARTGGVASRRTCRWVRQESFSVDRLDAERCPAELIVVCAPLSPSFERLWYIKHQSSHSSAELSACPEMSTPNRFEQSTQSVICFLTQSRELGPVGGAENAGVENVAPDNKGGNWKTRE